MLFTMQRALRTSADDSAPPTAGAAGRLLRTGRRQRGQSLAELAILLPALMVLLLGAIDYGRVYFAYISITNAARTGAEFASASPDAAADIAGIRAAALADTDYLLDKTATNPDVTASTGVDLNGDQYTEVRVRYHFDTLVSWPGLPTSLDLERSVRMRVAR